MTIGYMARVAPRLTLFDALGMRRCGDGLRALRARDPAHPILCRCCSHVAKTAGCSTSRHPPKRPRVLGLFVRNRLARIKGDRNIHVSRPIRLYRFTAVVEDVGAAI